jgi:hypothetical protein
MHVYNSVRRVDCVIATAMGEIAMTCEWSGRALPLERTVRVCTVTKVYSTHSHGCQKGS